MSIFEHVRFVGGLAALALALAPSSGIAQPAVAPAPAIRVIEFVDPYSGERDRRVADDLTEAEISRLQNALAAAGFDPGRATGVWNAATREELGRFQASRGLLRCECLTYETLVALGIRPQVVASIHAAHGSGYGSTTIMLGTTHGRHLGGGHGSGIVVGHGPSVFAGHQPARGAGELGRRPHVRDRSPRFRDRGHDSGRGPRLDPRPPRPRPGGSISGSGAPLRSLTPRQQPPTP
jgi:hypothetical protein